MDFLQCQRYSNDCYISGIVKKSIELQNREKQNSDILNNVCNI